MKKQVVAGLMVAVAMISFGCSGRNAEFGVVDMKAVESRGCYQRKGIAGRND